MNRERFLRMNDNGREDTLHTATLGSPSPRRSVPVSSPPSEAVGVTGGVIYILHTVSKFDTLAGIAIKYGVEVADIKRLNGLATDLQIFALKKIQIPLPGRHPPSPSLSNGCDTPRLSSSQQAHVSSRWRSDDVFDAFPSLKLKSSSEQKVSPAIRSLQSYYGPKPTDQKGATEVSEMTVYRNGGAHYLEDGPLTKSPTILIPAPSQPRRSENTANFVPSENGNKTDQVLAQESENSRLDRMLEKMVRGRQKSEVDSTSRTPEKILKEESTSGSSIPSITGKGLALRPKSAYRTILETVNGDAGGPNPIPIGLGDSLLPNTISTVQKTSSATSLQDSENNTLSSIWSLKPDFQVLSSVSIAMPILDSLSKPTSRRNKTAVD